MAILVGMSEAILLIHGKKCRYCGKKANGVDHVVPSISNGSDRATNLIAACQQCNSRKGARRLPAEIEKELLLEAGSYAEQAEQLALQFRNAVKRAKGRTVISTQRSELLAADQYWKESFKESQGQAAAQSA